MTNRSHRLKCLALAIFLYAIFPVAWLIRPYITKINITTCFFKTITGKNCPFCGLTRSLAFAMHGEFEKAFNFHPLWWLAALMIALIGSISLYEAFNSGDWFSQKRIILEWIAFATIALFAIIQIFF